MSALTADAQPHDQEPRTRARTRRRWFVLYVALAAISVLTVGASLYVNDRVLHAYEQSATEGEAWNARRNLIAELGELAEGVNAPGNDVFDTRDVAGERRRMEAAHARFSTALAAARAELAAQLSPEAAVAVLHHLARVDSAMSAMAASARRTFDDFAAGRMTRAARDMAAMDRAYARTNRELRSVRDQMSALQQYRLGEKHREAAVLHRVVSALAAAAVLMIIAIVLYGRDLSNTITAWLDERERQGAELERSEQRYRALNQELEQRIAERTEVLTQAASALVAQQRFLSQVLDTMPDHVYARDRDGRFTLVNRSYAAARGSSIEAMLGRTDIDLGVDPEKAGARRRTDLRVMDSLEEYVLPLETYADPTGHTHWLQRVKRPVVGPDGRADQVLVIATDITERKRTEATLAQFEAIVASSAYAIVSVNPDATIRAGTRAPRSCSATARPRCLASTSAFLPPMRTAPPSGSGWSWCWVASVCARSTCAAGARTARWSTSR